MEREADLKMIHEFGFEKIVESCIVKVKEIK